MAGLNLRISFMFWVLSARGNGRLHKKIIITSCFRSIQKEQPVQPRCPTVWFEKYLPELEEREGVSKANARVCGPATGVKKV